MVCFVPSAVEASGVSIGKLALQSLNVVEYAL